jgi:PAS domain S-box-containing protein
MTLFKQSIKNKLGVFVGLVALLFVLFLIFQYNSYVYTRKLLNKQELINKTKLVPEKIKVLHERFIQSEVMNETYYLSEKSSTLDSITALINEGKQNYDNISTNINFAIRRNTLARISFLKENYNQLQNKYKSLDRQLVGRGLYTTGVSGEWVQFGQYLVELSALYNNPNLVKSVADINKSITSYQVNKSEEQMALLLERINTLKVSVQARNAPEAAGLSEPNRLKITNELNKLFELTIAVRNYDVKLGLISGSGALPEINQLIQVINALSSDVYADLMYDANRRFLFHFLWIVTLLLVVAGFYLWLFYKYSEKISETVSSIHQFASDLTLGRLPNGPKLDIAEDLSEISSLFSKFVNSLRDKIHFATKLEAGHTDEQLTPLSEDDTLANALLDVEKSLQKAAEEDLKYKAEEQKRAWTNEGLARFGEILRMKTDNLAALSDEIIANLVKYLHANVGEVFLYNDDNAGDAHLELVSAFAYDRKKHLNKRIELNEGLVGTCALEQLPIFITDVPEDYIEITSGLGDAPPRSILLVPLKVENQVFGVIEIASFNVLQPFEIEFVEKIAQSIASTFATVKININTAQLLLQSKKQAEEMAQQEEEMRQNLEELQATQEESARREAEINSLASAIDSSALVIQTDMDGRIIEVNRKFASAVKINRDEAIGRYLRNIFNFDAETEEFYNLLKELKAGKTITRTEHIFDEKEPIYLEIHYTPILNYDHIPYKVLGIATNISSIRHLEQALSKREEAYKNQSFFFNQFKDVVHHSFMICELLPNCTIVDTNENYQDVMGYKAEELQNKDYRSFLQIDESKQFEVIWAEVMKDKPYRGVLKRTRPTGEINWLMSSIVPHKDKSDNIDKVFIMAQDITEKKLKYHVLEEANKEIERLKGLLNKNNE